MRNPYQVLGVSDNASPEEIRAAYLALVKKYHPDKYTDSDLKELANEKLIEVNEAYETLTKKQSQGSAAHGANTYGSYGYSGGGSAYSGPEAADFNRARAYINAGDLASAKRVLDSIQSRNSQWYYLYGIIYLREGWYDKANEYIGRAYRQEPGNAEYAQAYNTLRHTGNPYVRSSSSGQGGSCSGCDVCGGLLCADCCCECMGGDLIRCC